MHWTALPSIAIFASLLAVIVWNSLRRRRRSYEIANLFSRLGLHRQPSSSPPATLTFEGTDFERRAKFSDVYGGTLGGRSVACFNVFKHAGKGGWSRSVVAIRTSQPIALRPPTELQVHSAGGGWRLLYIPRHFMDDERLLNATEMEGILQQIAALAPEHPNL